MNFHLRRRLLLPRPWLRRVAGLLENAADAQQHELDAKRRRTINSPPKSPLLSSITFHGSLDVAKSYLFASRLQFDDVLHYDAANDDEHSVLPENGNSGTSLAHDTELQEDPPPMLNIVPGRERRGGMGGTPASCSSSGGSSSSSCLWSASSSRSSSSRSSSSGSMAP
jgi:hypothetical protein